MVETITPRAPVQAFAELMERKLQAVDDRHPEGWGNDTLLALFTRADDRMDRLYAAIDSSAPASLVAELSADVSNWMMMIADNVGAFTNNYGK